MSLRILAKPLLYSFFHCRLKNKAVNKTACRMPPANLFQLCGYYLKGFLTVMTIFLDFLDFLSIYNHLYILLI